MKTTKLMVVAAAVIVLGLYCVNEANAQGPALPAVSGTVAFQVVDGNCAPQAVTTSAGRNLISFKLSSSKPQTVMLVTPGTQPKIFLQHTQSGTAERWSTSLMLVTGSYEVVSSIGGQKCSLTVN